MPTDRYRFRLIAATGVALAVGSGAKAIPDELLRTIPADALAVVAIEPGAGGDHGGILQLAAAITAQAHSAGLLSLLGPDTDVWANALTSLPLLFRHPLAVALLDAQARPLPGGGARLAQLQAAAVFDTGGANAGIEQRVQELLSVFTNTQTTSLVTRTRPDGTVSYSLIDNRLPEWAVMRWGAVDRYYVLAFGVGAFDAVARTIDGDRPALSDDHRFAGAHRRCGGESAGAEWFVRVRRVRNRLGSAISDRTDATLDALGLADVDTGLWALGRRDRVIQAAAMLYEASSERFMPIAGSAPPGSLRFAVPPQAASYTVVHYPPRRLVHLARDAYLATRRDATQDRLHQFWTSLEQELRISVERDLLAHLGERLIVHTYPPHPLAIPLLCTVVVEINGDPAVVTRTIDALLGRWRQHLLDDGDDDDDLLALTVRRTADDIWYIRRGLNGPAAAVIGRYLVVSFSPQAVRQNARFLQSGAVHPGR